MHLNIKRQVLLVVVQLRWVWHFTLYEVVKQGASASYTAVISAFALAGSPAKVNGATFLNQEFAFDKIIIELVSAFVHLIFVC